MFKFIKRMLSPVEYTSPIYIFGFDSVLTLPTDAIDHDDWRALNRAKPNNTVLSMIVALMYCGCDVRIWTARPNSQRAEVVYWISQHLNVSEKEVSKLLYMRGDANDPVAVSNDEPSLSETELKEIWIKSMSNKDHFRVAAAYEYFQAHCFIWTCNGINCFSVMHGEL